MHVARGVLLGNELAVFPLPRHVELRSDMRLHVLISPGQPAPDDVIERILPLRVDVSSLSEDPRARVAVVGLAHPSRYGRADTDRSALQARLAPFLDGVSLPQAFEDAGMLADQEDGDRAERVLTQIVRVESAQARRMITHQLGSRPADVAAHLLAPSRRGVPAAPAPPSGPLDDLALAPS